MALSVQTLIAGDVFVLLCTGRIVFGDEDAILRERVGNMLPGTPKIVINLKAVEYIDSGGLGVLVGLFVSARNRGGELVLKGKTRHSLQRSYFRIDGGVLRACFLPVDDVALNPVRIELTSETIAEYGLEMMLPPTFGGRKGLPAVGQVVAIEQGVEIGDQKPLVRIASWHRASSRTGFGGSGR